MDTRNNPESLESLELAAQQAVIEKFFAHIQTQTPPPESWSLDEIQKAWDTFYRSLENEGEKKLAEAVKLAIVPEPQLLGDGKSYTAQDLWNAAIALAIPDFLWKQKAGIDLRFSRLTTAITRVSINKKDGSTYLIQKANPEKQEPLIALLQATQESREQYQKLLEFLQKLPNSSIEEVRKFNTEAHTFVLEKYEEIQKNMPEDTKRLISLLQEPTDASIQGKLNAAIFEILKNTLARETEHFHCSFLTNMLGTMGSTSPNKDKDIQENLPENTEDTQGALQQIKDTPLDETLLNLFLDSLEDIFTYSEGPRPSQEEMEKYTISAFEQECFIKTFSKIAKDDDPKKKDALLNFFKTQTDKKKEFKEFCVEHIFSLLQTEFSIPTSPSFSFFRSPQPPAGIAECGKILKEAGTIPEKLQKLQELLLSKQSPSLSRHPNTQKLYNAMSKCFPALKVKSVDDQFTVLFNLIQAMKSARKNEKTNTNSGDPYATPRKIASARF